MRDHRHRLLIAMIAWLVFALADLYSRDDIGGIKKTLWLAAFLLWPGSSGSSTGGALLAH